MKAKYMMDTDTCIYLKRRRPPEVEEKFRYLQRGQVVMSMITYGELYNGATKSREAKAALNNLEKLSEHIPVQAMALEVATHYGKIRNVLEKQGNVIAGNDLWIAAHALSLDLIVVTNNTDEFSRVPGLQIENWLDAPLH